MSQAASTFDRMKAALAQEFDFRICYKDASLWMRVIAFFGRWTCPDFMTRYTTVWGRGVYFPSAEKTQRYPAAAARTLAHEAVHLLDIRRLGWWPFLFLYLFPQVLVAGVLAFPWLGWDVAWFLVFGLPWPAPFRYYFEARAYALDLLTALPGQEESAVAHAQEQFSGWAYYRMWPFPAQVRRRLMRYAEMIRKEKYNNIGKIRRIYNNALDSSEVPQSIAR